MDKTSPENRTIACDRARSVRSSITEDAFEDETVEVPGDDGSCDFRGMKTDDGRVNILGRGGKGPFRSGEGGAQWFKVILGVANPMPMPLPLLLPLLNSDTGRGRCCDLTPCAAGPVLEVVELVNVDFWKKAIDLRREESYCGADVAVVIVGKYFGEYFLTSILSSRPHKVESVGWL